MIYSSFNDFIQVEQQLKLFIETLQQKSDENEKIFQSFSENTRNLLKVLIHFENKLNNGSLSRKLSKIIIN